MCNDKIPLSMVLGCIYIHTYWSHVYTDLGEIIGHIDWEREWETHDAWVSCVPIFLERF